MQISEKQKEHLDEIFTLAQLLQQYCFFTLVRGKQLPKILCTCLRSQVFHRNQMQNLILYLKLLQLSIPIRLLQVLKYFKQSLQPNPLYHPPLPTLLKMFQILIAFPGFPPASQTDTVSPTFCFFLGVQVAQANLIAN